METAPISLATLAGGALEEQFTDALQSLLNNIQDVNTAPTTKRELTLKVTVTPSKDRSIGLVTMAVNAKLAPPKPAETTIFMGFDKKGQAVATEKEQPVGLFAQKKQNASV